jgi:hypothetical protein
VYNFLPQEKFSYLYNLNEPLFGNFANIFCLLISLHLSFTNLNISFQWHSCWCLHTNANPILCSKIRICKHVTSKLWQVYLITNRRNYRVDVVLTPPAVELKGRKIGLKNEYFKWKKK